MSLFLQILKEFSSVDVDTYIVAAHGKFIFVFTLSY